MVHFLLPKILNPCLKKKKPNETQCTFVFRYKLRHSKKKYSKNKYKINNNINNHSIYYECGWWFIRHS
jgi:hypothetical protein